VQELRAPTRDLLDRAMPTHDRVHDDFPGWEIRSNIWWRRDLFELVDSGVEDVGMLSEHSMLFWTRLRPTQPDSPEELLFSTAHLSYQRNPGYKDAFTALGRYMPATHPVPAAASMGGIWSLQSPLGGVSKGIDVIFTRGPLTTRSSEVVEFFYEGRVPSDHAPVVATFTFDRQL